MNLREIKICYQGATTVCVFSSSNDSGFQQALAEMAQRTAAGQDFTVTQTQH